MNKLRFAERLRDLRGRLPRKSVANAIGISESALAMYESGDRTPRDEVKIKLAEFYGKDVQSIFFAE